MVTRVAESCNNPSSDSYSAVSHIHDESGGLQVSSAPKREACFEFVRLYDVVSATGKPNYLGARSPVLSQLHISTWRELLIEYEDYVVCEFLEFGWPVNYKKSTPPTVDHRNHKGACLIVPRAH